MQRVEERQDLLDAMIGRQSSARRDRIVFFGLSAFPLTPSRDGEIAHDALARLVAAAAAAGVDSIGALGSTGSYAYLERPDRRAVARTAVQAAGRVPVIVGVGAISTSAVLRNVEDAVSEGAAGVLLAPVSYQPLTNIEVFRLFADVTERFSVPVVVYDNVATTGFTFTTQLLGEIANLPSVASIKLDTLPADPSEAAAHIRQLRSLAPERVSIGISGDAMSPSGILAGCDVWYSVLGGLFPRTCVAITEAARSGDADHALSLTAELAPVWDLFARFGSYRAIAAMATLAGELAEDAVYAPVLPLTGQAREMVAAAVAAIGPRS